jgi:hypothetical protein
VVCLFCPRKIIEQDADGSPSLFDCPGVGLAQQRFGAALFWLPSLMGWTPLIASRYRLFCWLSLDEGQYRKLLVRVDEFDQA